MRAACAGVCHRKSHSGLTMSNKTTETFLPVPGYDSYECSTHGRVRRIGSVECLTPSPAAGKRYLAVCMSKNGRAKTEYVHRIAALTWLGPIPKGYCVHHRDSCRYNNHCGPDGNLEIVTRQQNAAYSHADGTAHVLKGEKCPERQSGKVSATQVRVLRRAHGKRGLVSKLAREWGFSAALAGAVARGTLYTNILDTALETEIAREEAIAARNIRKAISASKRARASRKANTHKHTPPATIVGAK